MFTQRRFIIPAMFLLGCWVAPARAQVEETPIGSLQEIKDAYKSPEALLKKLKSVIVSTKESPPEKADLDIIDGAAKLLVCQVTWPEHSGQKELVAAIKQFEFEYLSTTAANAQSSPEFNAKACSYFLKVFERDFNGNRLTGANAAQLLPIAARGKRDEVAKLLVTLINDPKQHDAVKFYALRGLREYFPVVTAEEPPKDHFERCAERIHAVTSFIERKWPTATDPEELEAIHYLRREAIRTLARAEAPAVIYNRKTKMIEGQVGFTLLRVLSQKDGLDPPANLSEKCIAAMALCDMKLSLCKERLPRELYEAYEPSLAIYAAGLTLKEFIETYQKTFNAKGQAPELNWKVTADQWKVSLNNLKEKNLVYFEKGSQPKMMADVLQASTESMLNAISQHKALQNFDVTAFRNNWPKQRPATKKLFKIDKMEIDLGE